MSHQAQDILAFASSEMESAMFIEAERSLTSLLGLPDAYQRTLIQALVLRGSARMMMGKTAEATGDWKAVLALVPTHEEAHLLLHKSSPEKWARASNGNSANRETSPIPSPNVPDAQPPVLTPLEEHDRIQRSLDLLETSSDYDQVMLVTLTQLLKSSSNARFFATNSELIPRLIPLLRDIDIGAKSFAVSCIAELFVDVPARLQGIKLGAVQALVALLSSDDSDVLFAAARALCAATSHAEGRQAASQANIIATIVPLIREVSRNGRLDVRAQDYLVIALGNSVHSHQSVNAAVRAGALRVILPLVQVRNMAASQALVNITEYSNGQSAAVESGAISILVTHLNCDSENAGLVIQALMNITQQDVAEALARVAGAIPHIVIAMQYDRRAIQILGNITTQDAMSRGIACDCGAVPILCQLLRDPESANVSAFVLSNLLHLPYAQAQAWQCNCVPSLISLLHSEDVMAFRPAAEALSCLVQSEHNLEVIMDEAWADILRLMDCEDEEAQFWAVALARYVLERMEVGMAVPVDEIVSVLGRVRLNADQRLNLHAERALHLIVGNGEGGHSGLWRNELLHI